MAETEKHQAIRARVGRRYAAIVQESGQSCCGDTDSPGEGPGGNCCATEAGSTDAGASSCSGEDSLSRGSLGRGEASRHLGYSDEELQAVPAGSNLGLGCGNPGAIAALAPGETVLDLGSGAGFDCFLAARQVGAAGLVIGVDMTPEMLTKARDNASRHGYANVEFRLGEIEQLPAGDASVDVIISNCVINLSPEKQKVFNESYRVLRPGGRVAVSDIVSRAPLPAAIRRDPEKYCGCIAGAATIDEVKTMLADAGFVDIRIELNEASKRFIKDWLPESGAENYVISASIMASKPEDSTGCSADAHNKPSGCGC